MKCDLLCRDESTQRLIYYENGFLQICAAVFIDFTTSICVNSASDLLLLLRLQLIMQSTSKMHFVNKGEHIQKSRCTSEVEFLQYTISKLGKGA